MQKYEEGLSDSITHAEWLKLGENIATSSLCVTNSKIQLVTGCLYKSFSVPSSSRYFEVEVSSTISTPLHALSRSLICDLSRSLICDITGKLYSVLDFESLMIDFHL